MTKGAKTAAGIAVAVGLGVAGWFTYKHFAKGTAPKTGPSLAGASTTNATQTSNPAGIAIAGLNALPGTLNAINGLLNPTG